MLISFLQGLLVGTAVSTLNHFLTLWALRPAEADQKKAKTRVMGVYILRYALNFLTLFLFFRNAAALIGAAVGLTMVKNVLFIRNLAGRRG